MEKEGLHSFHSPLQVDIYPEFPILLIQLNGCVSSAQVALKGKEGTWHVEEQMDLKCMKT